MNQGADKAFVVDPNVRIGHVHLKVADLDRALKFYSGILGFQITQRLGEGAVFLSAGGYHHHIALNTWESLGGSPPPRGTTGLYHTAIVYPTRAALAATFRRVLEFPGLPAGPARLRAWHWKYSDGHDACNRRVPCESTGGTYEWYGTEQYFQLRHKFFGPAATGTAERVPHTCGERVRTG